jgi:hypothetical protein
VEPLPLDVSFVDPNLEWVKQNSAPRDGGQLRSPSVVILAEFEKEDRVVALTKEFAESRFIRISPLFLNTAVQPISKFCSLIVAREFLENGFNAKKFGIVHWELGVPVVPQKEIPVNSVICCDGKTVLAVIDDFVAYRHPEFSVNKKSRIVAVWDQDPIRAASQYWKTSSPAQPSNVPFGAEFSPSMGSDAYPKILGRETHGTGVAGVLGGKTTPSYRLTRHDASRDPSRWGEVADAASSAPIIAVHLPSATVRDTSGATLTSHVLYALHYIIARCAPTANVVVNLSYGTMGGPHDDSEILANAIAHLTTLMAGRLTVYIASGNSRELKGHANFDLKPASSQLLSWKLMPECRTSSLMDIWLPAGATGAVAITLTSPIGDTCTASLLNGASFAELKNSSGFTVGRISCPAASPLGEGRAWARIFVLPTALGVKFHAPHGIWKILIQSENAIANVHAWIERNDTAPGYRVRSYQSRFMDSNYLKYASHPGLVKDTVKSYIKRRGTLNGRATHRDLNVVGAYCLSNQRLSTYSSTGDRGYVRAPTMTAPGDESRSLPGIRVIAIGGVDTVRLRGTSISSPIAAREAFNRISSSSTGSSLPSLIPSPINSIEDMGNGLFDPRP